MKEKMLQGMGKKTLRQCVKTLSEKPCDKLPREKLIQILRAYSYVEIVRSIQI